MKNLIFNPIKLEPYFAKLYKKYGSHAEAARQLGITPIFYCAVRKGREKPSHHLIKFIKVLANQDKRKSAA